MAFSNEGQIVRFHPAESLAVILTTEGELVRSFEIPVIEAHGFTLSTLGFEQSIWIADNGRKRDPGANYDYLADTLRVRAIRVSMSGLVEMELFEPGEYRGKGELFSPTSVIAFDQHLVGTMMSGSPTVTTRSSYIATIRKVPTFSLDRWKQGRREI